MFNKLKNSAFTLVEIAIVVAIIGVILGGTLDVVANAQQKQKIQDTNYILDRIQNAIYSYHADNSKSFIPCPAINTKGYAEQNQFSNQNCVQSYGAIPYRNLSLPRDFMYDAWGRLITYVIVNNGCTYRSYRSNNVPVTYNFFTEYPNCNISNGLSFYSKATGGNLFASNAVYMLISHGKSGYGSMIANESSTQGQYKPIAYASADKVQNANYYGTSNLNYVYRAANDTNTNYFDDIIRYDDFMSIIRKGRYFLGTTPDSVGTNAYFTDTICNLFNYNSWKRFMLQDLYNICDGVTNCVNKLWIVDDIGSTVGDGVYQLFTRLCVYNKSQT